MLKYFNMKNYQSQHRKEKKYGAENINLYARMFELSSNYLGYILNEIMQIQTFYDDQDVLYKIHWT